MRAGELAKKRETWAVDHERAKTGRAHPKVDNVEGAASLAVGGRLAARRTRRFAHSCQRGNALRNRLAT